MRIKNYTLIAFAVLFTAGCLDTDFEEPNTDFILTASLGDGIEDRLEMNGDELRIFSVRFFIDDIEIMSTQENERFESSPTYVGLNTIDITGETTIGAGFIFGGSYTGVGFSLTLPPADANIDDELLIIRNNEGEVTGRNTLAITGTYNGVGFTILSDATEDLQYSFDRTIEMPETEGSLQVNLIAEWETWFTDDSMESLIDPTDASNQQQIIDNFMQYFTAQTLTIGEL